MNQEKNVVHLDDLKKNLGGNGGGNGTGNGIITHRLDQLEQQVNKLETKVDALKDQSTRMDEKMKEVATKSDVLRLFVVSLSVAVLTLIGHLLIRTIG